MKDYQQQEYMRGLIVKHGRNRTIICMEYAEAERKGVVERVSNKNQLSELEYADYLYCDVQRRLGQAGHKVRKGRQ